MPAKIIRGKALSYSTKTEEIEGGVEFILKTDVEQIGANVEGERRIEVILDREQLRVLVGSAVSALGYTESAPSAEGKILLEPKPWLKNP